MDEMHQSKHATFLLSWCTVLFLNVKNDVALACNRFFVV